MLVQSRDYGDDYKNVFPDGSEGQKAFAAVAAAVAKVDELITTQLTAKRVSSTGKFAARMGVVKHIAAIARSARVLAKATPGADERFPLPVRKGDIAMLHTGRLFLQEAASVKDALIRCGLAPTFMEDLQQSVAAFERSIGVRSAGRAGAAVAREGIRAAVKGGVDAVRSLDALVLNVLGHDVEAMARWKRDRHVDMTGKTASVGTPAARPTSVDGGQPPVATGVGEGSAAAVPAADVGTVPTGRAS